MRFIIVILICSLIFCAWLFYEQRKSQRIQRMASDEFWAREELANSTRNKDISHLPLIQVEDGDIPFLETQDETILYYIGQLRQIIHEPMIDLSEHSNTDLKLAYGVGNFKTLSEYDENFNTFLIALTNLARSYERSGYHDEAEKTYLAAMRYGSRRVTDYEELAKIYLVTHHPDKVRSLIREVESGGHPRREKIAALLNQLLANHR